MLNIYDNIQKTMSFLFQISESKHNKSSEISINLQPGDLKIMKLDRNVNPKMMQK